MNEIRRKIMESFLLSFNFKFNVLEVVNFDKMDWLDPFDFIKGSIIESGVLESTNNRSPEEAMQYLLANDPTLEKSLAEVVSYYEEEIDTLTSTELARILESKLTRDWLETLKQPIEEFVEKLDYIELDMECEWGVQLEYINTGDIRHYESIKLSATTISERMKRSAEAIIGLIVSNKKTYE